jgi:uncharacterized protein
MWRSKLLDLVKEMNHPVWGISHFKRIYDLTNFLGKSQENQIDDDVIFAAAYLHDIGVFSPYRQEGKEHSEVSAHYAEKILNEFEFPLEKISLVRDVIRGHMYYSKSKDILEVQLFHDADTLDFMGSIGISRILSIVGIDDWTPDLKSAVKLIQKFSNELLQRLYTDNAKKIGSVRKREMDSFLLNLASQTRDLNDL